MKTIVHKSSGGHSVVGILKGSDWFPADTLFQLYKDYFVVVTWFEYSNGRTVSCEGKTTVAMCQKMSDASLIFERF